MKKIILAAAILGCSVSMADAMPLASTGTSVSALPIVKAEVVVRRTVVRRRPVMVRRSHVVKRVIVR